MGRIRTITRMAGEYRLTVEPGFDWDGPLVLGESIAVSGVCLTVTEAAGRAFTAHVSGETVSRTTMSSYKPGDRVNLERALRLSDRLGGHLVAGHVDGLGVIRDLKEKDRSLVFTFGLDSSLSRYMIEKGSVAVDGVSLTVNDIGSDAFTINLIPHSAELTTLGFKKTGDYVNLEVDMIGKYVARLMGRDDPGERSDGSGLDKSFLAEHGFL